MAVRVLKNPLDGRPRERDIDVAVDAATPESGTVLVRFCEVPKGMVADIKDDIEICIATQRNCINDIDTIGATLTAEAQKILESDMPAPTKQADIDAMKASMLPKIAELQTLQRAERKKLVHLQLRLITWAVIGHKPDDFCDGDNKPVEFISAKEIFDNVEYKVASIETINHYRSVGEGFIDNMYHVAIDWQKSRVLSAQSIWDKHKKDAADREQVLRKMFADIVKKSGVTVEANGENESDADFLAHTTAQTPSPKVS